MDIDRSQWIELSALLDDALDLDPGQRDGWLQALSGAQAALREPLRTLLAQRALVETDDFLKTPDLVAALRRDAAQRIPAAQGLEAGHQVGAYRLLRELGQGGMGYVWLAERVDGRFERQVALKFPYAGVHRRQLAERLGRERDILARLEHPNIARLYDADVTALDQPFLVLEYVDGIPIGDYCNQHHLPVRERLVLFLQVLGATRYAHSHLVIHRDLKPSNILITADRIARLLDFGIAKLTSEGEARETALTQFGGRALTPEYASPEQIAGQPLTTASDVYSLGVVLYELLTGTRPYRLKRDSRASLEEAIADADVVAPSRARLGPEVAQQRATTPDRLVRELRGDLDAILLKALRKDLSQRYASVDALTLDVKHWLDGEMVEAQPPSTWYRFGKMVRRNRLAFGAAAAIAVSLLAGAAVALWQAHVALAQAARLQATKSFLVDVFNANSVDQPDPLKAQQTTARELLDRAAMRLDAGTHPADEETEEMLAVLGGLYRDLGLDERSAALQRRRAALMKQMYGGNDVRYAAAQVDYAKSVYATDDWRHALEPLQEAERILDAHHDESSYTRGQQLGAMAEYLRGVDRKRSREYAERGIALERRYFPTGTQLIQDLRLAALIDTETANRARARPLLREALALQERNSGPEVLLIQPLAELGELENSQLDNAAATAHFERGLEITLRINGEAHVDTVQTRMRFGKHLLDTGQLREAVEMLQAAERGAVSAVGENETFHLPSVRDQLGQAEFALGEYAIAADLYRRALAARERTRSGNRQHSNMLLNYARLLNATGHAAESAPLVTRALEGYAKSEVQAGASDVPVVMSTMYSALGRTADALRALDRYTDGRELLTPGMTRQQDLRRAEIYVELGEVGRAEEILRRQLQAVRGSQVEQWRLPTAQIELQLGRLLLEQGAAQEARPLLESSLQTRAALLSVHSPLLADSQAALAECLLTLGESARSRTLFDSAAVIQAFNVELADQYRRPFLRLRDRLLAAQAVRPAR